MKKFPLILTTLSCHLAWAAPDQAQEQAWKEALGSTVFQERFKASQEIWKAGREIVPFLEELANGGDPEIAERSRDLVLKIRSGLTPDTPDEIVAKVNRFLDRNATERSKVAVLEELLALEEYGFIFKLRNLESNERVVDRADSMIQQSLQLVIQKLAANGDFEEVKSLLALGKDFSTMIAFANLAEQLGSLDEEIERLRDSDSTEEQARYLACLRVKGDAQLLRSEAKRLGDPQTEVLAALAAGDYVPYFEYLLENQNQSLVAGHYLQWSVAMAKGDPNAVEKAKDALVHLTKDSSEGNGARSMLFRMGYLNEAVASYRPSDLILKYSYLIGSEIYPEILPLFGLENDVLTDEWLKKASADYLDGLANEGIYGTWNKIFIVASFYENRGLTGESLRCFQSIAGGVKKQRQIKFIDWLAVVYQECPEAAFKLIVQAIEDDEIDVAGAIETVFARISFYNNPEAYQWVFDSMEDLFPKAPLEELLRLTVTFASQSRTGSGHILYVSEEKFNDAHEKLLGQVLNSAEKVSGLRYLYEFAAARGCSSDVTKLRELLEAEGQTFPDRYKAEYARDLMDYQKAGELFSKIEIDPGNLRAPDLMYQKGTALKKAGLDGGDELRRQALLYTPGGPSELARLSSLNRRYGYDDLSLELDQKALLRIDLFDDELDAQNLMSLLENLAREAVNKRDWEKAIAYREVEALLTASSAPVYNLRARFQVLVARGGKAMQSGDIVEAADRFTEAYSLIPNDGFLANDFFPLIRDLGLVELHDQLFAKSARYLRDIIQKYPGDDNVYNNFAWMASRANRCLDEAEEYLKKGLEIRPRSAAYLDTMGEIYFARRNREEAIRWSDISREYAMSDVELQEQNRRFKTGEFPTP